MDRGTRAGRRGSDVRLGLTSEFQLQVDQRSVAVPPAAQRLLACLGVARQPVHRSRIAGQLWPDVAEERALGNLRSALWRLRRVTGPAVRSLDARLDIDPGVRVDLKELTDVAAGILGGRADALAQLPALIAAGDVLPGWDEPWLVGDRERFRELRLRALERACEAALERRAPDESVEACFAAVEAEPFRESAQRLLVRLHLRDGNRAAALRSYRSYRELIGRELGVEPSDLMAELVAGLAAFAVL